MADAPIQLKKVTPGDVVAVPTGSVGFFAGSDGKFYAKDGSSAAAEIGALDTDAVQDIVDTSLADYATTADVNSALTPYASLGFASRFTGRRVVLFGDSITDMCGGTRLDGSVQNHFMNGYWTGAQWLLGHRFRLVVNAGVSGDSTAMMLARINADVISKNPDVVVVFGGVNDVGSATVGNIDSIVSGTTSNLAAIYDALTAAGIMIVAIPIWPVSAFRSGWESATYPRLAISRINQWIYKRSESQPNMIIADIGAAFRNPNANNEPYYNNDTSINPAGYPNYLTDGLHPGASAAFAAGKILANVLDNAFPAQSFQPMINETQNYLPNPDLRGAVNSPLAAPTGYTLGPWAGGATLTLSYVDRDDGIAGRRLRLEQTVGYVLSCNCRKTADFMQTGDVFVAEAEVRVTSGFVQPRLDLDMRDLGAASHFKRRDGYRDGAAIGGTEVQIDTRVTIPLNTPLLLRTPPCTVPVAANGGSIEWTLFLVGTGTVDVGRVCLRKLIP